MNILNLFTRKSALIENGAVVTKEFVPTLPLDIYQDLPAMPSGNIGPNGEALYRMIADAYPEGVLYPHAKENRIKLYRSIYFLRTQSSEPWVYDKVVANEPKVFLLHRVAKKQQLLH
jgi:hypothetical protein